MTVDELRAALPRAENLAIEAQRVGLCELLAGLANGLSGDRDTLEYRTMTTAVAFGAAGYAVWLGVLTGDERDRLVARFEALLTTAEDADDYCHYCNSPKTPGESHAHCARAGRAQADREDAERAAAEDGEDADE